MADEEFYRASVDPYGFERPEDFDYQTYDEFMANYLSVLARRAKKWEVVLGPSKDIKRSHKVKRYIRKGIPREHRGSLWMTICGAQDLKERDPNLYTKLLEGPRTPEVLETIRIDIPRTFPDNIYFKNAGDGKRQPLFNVLVALAHHNPNVGYCQGLNFIAGILLLITEDEETTFWLLQLLVDKILPDYYTKEMMGLLTDMEVLAELVRMKIPKVHQHLTTHSVACPLIASKWFICLFAEVLPIETVLRIWDCLFYEGSKILFRVSVTLIMKNEDKILQARNFPEILDVFKSITHDFAATDCHNFMQGIFKEPGSFPMALISKLRSQCRERVKAQQAQQQIQVKEQHKILLQQRQLREDQRRLKEIEDQRRIEEENEDAEAENQETNGHSDQGSYSDRSFDKSPHEGHKDDTNLQNNDKQESPATVRGHQNSDDRSLTTHDAGHVHDAISQDKQPSPAKVVGHQNCNDQGGKLKPTINVANQGEVTMGAEGADSNRGANPLKQSNT